MILLVSPSISIHSALRLCSMICFYPVGIHNRELELMSHNTEHHVNDGEADGTAAALSLRGIECMYLVGLPLSWKPIPTQTATVPSNMPAQYFFRASKDFPTQDMSLPPSYRDPAEIN